MAAGALENDSCGSVVAVFNRGAYIALGQDRLIFVSNEHVEAGPLVVGTSGAVSWPPLEVGEAVDLVHGTLRIANTVIVSLRNAKTWSPALFPDAAPEQLARGLTAIEAVAPCGNPLSAGRASERLATLLTQAGATVFGPDRHLASSTWPEDLRGLGPGLTPSGDDMLVGIVIAMRALGEQNRLSTLVTRIERDLDRATTPISAAHLRAAMGGAAVEPLHRVVNAVLDGASDTRALTRALDALMAVGHSSGRDALAGLLTTLLAANAART